MDTELQRCDFVVSLHSSLTSTSHFSSFVDSFGMNYWKSTDNMMPMIKATTGTSEKIKELRIYGYNDKSDLRDVVSWLIKEKTCIRRLW